MSKSNRLFQAQLVEVTELLATAEETVEALTQERLCFVMCNCVTSTPHRNRLCACIVRVVGEHFDIEPNH